MAGEGCGWQRPTNSIRRVFVVPAEDAMKVSELHGRFEYGGLISFLSNG